ncbi:FadR/GntR family transcriptional regulator [Saccharomonospora glauca]|uniref:Transcriptional regulator n=1 Tax=Saccharomonospora glauca K62 TaxID=928724 RepID=I1D3D8_9PSEU|nr:FCD domain-containing protein [Saccharomonospora glauca]EIE99462.1 transcriptional regulator [Saccharomonospora glauca K62]
MTTYGGRGVHGQTVATLGARIVSGALPRGSVLDLAALGRELDVSMTALRESLRVLAAKGLVEARQKRGTVVRGRAHWNLLDPDVIRWRASAGETARLLRDLGELRGMVEPAVAALAARRRDEADLTELDAALEDMTAAGHGDAEAAAAADLRWHRALLRATHNELVAALDSLVEPTLSLRDALVHEARATDPVPRHAAVVDAVRRRDPEAAEAAMRVLLAEAAEDVAGVVSDDRASTEEER